MKGQKPIGGFFELELQENSNYLHQNLIHLNTARNCFEYILRTRKYIKVYIPYFTCDVILEPLDKLRVKYEFYDVDNNLEPIFNFDDIKEKEGFLVTNYFGVKTNFINKLSSKISNLIVDSAQAFFAEPMRNTDTFYSPRKFVGVSDGGLLYTDLFLTESFEKDYSYDRLSHLLKRIDSSAEEGYKDFKINDKSLERQPIKWMSSLTQKLISSVDYEKQRKQRFENFNFLHNQLEDKNELIIGISKEDVPMVYPYKVKNANDLRRALLEKRVYCATYWPNVVEWCTHEFNSYLLAKEIIALPIDQRYTKEEMEYIIGIVCQ